ncbi:uncharacterized protein LOC110119053 [Ceratitis capitata]|uniref:uncharacterized protein LOC110119053 n=1 Tax=Ceratitis capitata TaxID=7213 RepID=UPI000A10F0C2|nr:uncharacterized protein LOC110119053 [Ceratitis capitata]
MGRRHSKNLTTSMQKKRLDWARRQRNMTVADWNRMSLSNEATFEILAVKSYFVRRRAGEQFHAECFVEGVKRPVSGMVCSVISAKGTGRLYIVEDAMRQDQYK